MVQSRTSFSSEKYTVVLLNGGTLLWLREETLMLGDSIPMGDSPAWPLLFSPPASAVSWGSSASFSGEWGSLWFGSWYLMFALLPLWVVLACSFIQVASAECGGAPRLSQCTGRWQRHHSCPSCSLLPAHAVWAALASPSWAESPSAFSPQGGSGPHYNGCSTNHLLSEPVMIFWLP